MGHFELMCSTSVLLGEIGDLEMTPADVALTYRLALQSSEKTDWPKVNAAIIQRWRLRGLNYIKKSAWAAHPEKELLRK